MHGIPYSPLVLFPVSPSLLISSSLPFQFFVIFYSISTCLIKLSCYHSSLLLLPPSPICLNFTFHVVDGDWCTAPSTPTGHKISVERQSSHEQSVFNSDSKGSSVSHSQLPRHISTSHTGPGMNGSSEVVSAHNQHQGGGKYPQMPAVGIPIGHATMNLTGGSATVVSSSQPPSRVHHGFTPNNPGVFDATKSGDLPGSRNERADGVITTPPHSQSSFSQATSRSRTKSIEDTDKSRENYAPGEASRGDPDGVQGSSSFCLGLSSYIMAQHNSDETAETKDSERGLKRKNSAASETSTISVRERVWSWVWSLA